MHMQPGYFLTQGEKIYMSGYDSVDGLPNITAFRVDRRTRENVIDVISCLAHTWQYIPNEEQLKKYLNIIEKYYDGYSADFIGRIVNAQKRTLKKALCS